VFILFVRHLNSKGVLAVTDQVQVTATVQNCTLRTRVYPEKRIPATGNWATFGSIQVRQPGGGAQVLNSNSYSTSNIGESTLNLCDLGIVLVDQNYDFYITGESHLRKRFANFPYSNAAGFVDFTVGGVVLLAGDTSIIKDNKVNSLDISTQIVNLNTNNSRNDLNKDSEVNSLDLSNTIYNFYKLGD
jgi:hypothetical protein